MKHFIFLLLVILLITFTAGIALAKKDTSHKKNNKKSERCIEHNKKGKKHQKRCTFPASFSKHNDDGDDNKGHGNDGDECDEDNPGNSKRCINNDPGNVVTCNMQDATIVGLEANLQTCHDKTSNLTNSLNVTNSAFAAYTNELIEAHIEIGSLTTDLNTAKNSITIKDSQLQAAIDENFSLITTILNKDEIIAELNDQISALVVEVDAAFIDGQDSVTCEVDPVYLTIEKAGDYTVEYLSGFGEAIIFVNDVLVTPEDLNRKMGLGVLAAGDTVRILIDDYDAESIDQIDWQSWNLTYLNGAVAIYVEDPQVAPVLDTVYTIGHSTAQGFTADDEGNLHIADTMNRSLLKFNPVTETIDHELLSWNLKDEFGTPVELNAPWSYATNDSGDLLYLDTGRLDIVTVDNTGTVISFFNAVYAAYDYPTAVTYGGGYVWVSYSTHVTQRDDDGTIIADISIDVTNSKQMSYAAGQLYFSDTVAHQIIVADAFTGEIVQTIGSGLGSADGQMNFPVGITVTDDAVYVGDRNNSRVAVFALDGTFLLNFGSTSDTLWAVHTIVTNDEIYVLHGCGGGLSKWNK